MDPKPPDDFIPVGTFSPREIKRVTDQLEHLDVDYEVEFDDSAIRDQSPVDARYGMFESATVRLYIDPSKRLEFDSVMEVLYPP